MRLWSAIALGALLLAPRLAFAGCADSSAVQQKPVAISTTTSVQLLTGPAVGHAAICAINLSLASSAENVALVAGIGATCGTNTYGLAGGATAATGWQFAANALLAYGDGIGMLYRTANVGDNVCLLVSGSGQISGNIVWTPVQ